MDQITLKEITFKTSSGLQNTLELSSSLTCDSALSSEVVCRLAIPRLPLSPAARLLLSLFVDETVAGIPRRHSYDELGRLLGRGTHTAVRAAAELRKAGLVSTVRAGFRSSQLLFVCDSFMASFTLGNTVSIERSEVPASDIVYGASETFAMDDHPDWPSVPSDWRRLYNVPVPSEDDWPYEYCIPVGVKPWLGAVPRGKDGSFDEEVLRRKPHQLYTDEELDAMLALVRAAEDAARRTEPKAVENEPPVDASAEREAEIRLAGPRRDDSSEDEFKFDSGADTAETDIGRGVKVNPDL